MFWSRAWGLSQVLKGIPSDRSVYESTWSDRQNCSHNVSQKTSTYQALFWGKNGQTAKDPQLDIQEINGVHDRSLSGTIMALKKLVLQCFGAMRRGRESRYWPPLTSWTVDWRVFWRFLSISWEKNAFRPPPGTGTKMHFSREEHLWTDAGLDQNFQGDLGRHWSI